MDAQIDLYQILRLKLCEARIVRNGKPSKDIFDGIMIFSIVGGGCLRDATRSLVCIQI